MCEKFAREFPYTCVHVYSQIQGLVRHLQVLVPKLGLASICESLALTCEYLHVSTILRLWPVCIGMHKVRMNDINSIIDVATSAPLTGQVSGRAICTLP